MKFIRLREDVSHPILEGQCTDGLSWGKAVLALNRVDDPRIKSALAQKEAAARLCVRWPRVPTLRHFMRR